MNANVNEITINGKTYVEKGKQSVSDLCENYYIVRTYSAGVFAGEIVSRRGKEVTMENARRLWFWDGAASLSQLAMEGVSKPENCKFPCEVTEVVLTEAIELLPCTEAAQKSIKGVPVWAK